MGGPADTHGSESTVRKRGSHPWLQQAHAWRERIRSNPATRLAWKVVTGLVGSAVLVAGLFMVPLPGPGWLVVILGLAILASEFAWAQRILHRLRHAVRLWTYWIGRQPWPTRIAVGAATGLFVLGVLYLVLLVLGVPDFVPGSLYNYLPGL